MKQPTQRDKLVGKSGYDVKFWGKLEEEGANYLPLEHHCLDVACVFRRLAALRTIRRRLERAAGAKLAHREGGFCFRIDDRHYRYTRLGLERESTTPTMTCD